MVCDDRHGIIDTGMENEPVIPLIPLDKMEEYVECLQCRNRFPRDALSHNREKALRMFHGYVRHTLALVAAADSEIKNRSSCMR